MAACPAPGSLTERVLQSEVSREADTRIARQHALEGSAGALEMAVGLAPALNVVGSGYVGVTASVPAVMVATMLLMLAGAHLSHSAASTSSCWHTSDLNDRRCEARVPSAPPALCAVV